MSPRPQNTNTFSVQKATSTEGNKKETTKGDWSTTLLLAKWMIYPLMNIYSPKIIGKINQWISKELETVARLGQIQVTYCGLIGTEAQTSKIMACSSTNMQNKATEHSVEKRKKDVM